MDDDISRLEARGVAIARELQALELSRAALRREAAILHRLLAYARGLPMTGATNAVRAVLHDADAPMTRRAIADAVRISRDHTNMILARLKAKGEAANVERNGWRWTGE